MMLKYTVRKYCSEGSRVNQVIMAVLLVIPAFSYGAAVGWMSPMSVKLMSGSSPAGAPVSEEVISWLASVAYLVGTPAVVVFAYVVDHYGRKKALVLTSLSMVACWGLKIYSTATWALITARAMIGLAVSGAYVVTPLYIKEISEDCIRGMLGSLVILSQNLGNLIGYIMGEYLEYHVVSWVCMAVPILHILAFTSMPETPSYLLKCGRVEDARDVLAWLRCRQSNEPLIEEELQNLVLEMQRNSEVKSCAILRSIDKTTFRAFRITLTITLARELCGCIAVLHFASMIFEQAAASTGGFVLSPNQQAAVLGAVQLVGSCTASSLVERIGRKPLLGATCLMSGLAMASLGLWFFLLGDVPEARLGWLPIVSLCVCIFCDAGGLQPVPFVIMTEIFTFQLRGTVTSLVIAFTCILVSIQLRLFQPLVSAVGMYMVFWFFAGVCLLSTLYIALYVPETKQKSLNEIYAQIENRKKTVNDSEVAVTRL